jgi:4-carboxymuconolactone decarboxylase
MVPVDDPRMADAAAKGLTGPDGQLLNIFGALANHPDLLRRWLVFASHVLAKNTVPPRERELLILRTGALCHSRYEWGQHVIIGRHAGLSDDEIEACKRGSDDPSWSTDDALVVRAAEELHAGHRITDATWQGLSARWSVPQLMDMVATVGNYHMVALLLNTLQVPLDAGVPDDPDID